MPNKVVTNTQGTITHMLKFHQQI